jgi:hypothetical protein
LILTTKYAHPQIIKTNQPILQKGRKAKYSLRINRLVERLTMMALQTENKPSIVLSQMSELRELLNLLTKERNLFIAYLVRTKL